MSSFPRRSRTAMTILFIASLAVPAQAQDFLGGLARRAATAAAARAVTGALTHATRGQGADPATPTAQPGAQPAATPQRSAAGGLASLLQGARADGDNAPEAEGLQGMPEDQRELECNKRVPMDPEGGRSSAKQEAFGRCMGPRYGDGG